MTTLTKQLRIISKATKQYADDLSKEQNEDNYKTLISLWKYWSQLVGYVHNDGTQTAKRYYKETMTYIHDALSKYDNNIFKFIRG